MASRERDAGFGGEQILIDLRGRIPNVITYEAEVPFLSLAAQHRMLEEEILERWRMLLRTGSFVGGDAVTEFEDELASYIGTEHAIGVANGTDAITLALRAIGVVPGDEVITAANTFFATVEAIVHAGATPVLADVEPDTGNIDPAAIEAAITSRTRCIIPVHLYGQPADMNAIMRIALAHDLYVVEDNAQAIGATFGLHRTGSIGHAAAFSFYPGKNLGATGDGGAVTTNDPDVAERVRVLADHGQRAKYDHVAIGYNSRLDAVHAAALTVKLRYLDTWTAKRRYVASEYAAGMRHLGLSLPTEADGRTHVYHLYVVRMPDRDAVRVSLAAKGVATGLHYPTAIHRTPPFSHLGAKGAYPVSESWASQGLSLPMFPELSDQQIRRVVESIAGVVEEGHVLARDTA